MGCLGDPSDELVTAAMSRFDEAWPLRIVRSALRNSWMQDVSASSLTTVPFHTEANSSSLRTGCPACVTSALSTADAFGVSLTSLLPDHSRPVSRSNRWRPKLTPCSIELFRLSSVPPQSRRNPGVLPGLPVNAHHTLYGGTTGEENTSWEPGRPIRAFIPRPAWP
jgi:hypothetical protein